MTASRLSRYTLVAAVFVTAGAGVVPPAGWLGLPADGVADGAGALLHVQSQPGHRLVGGPQPALAVLPEMGRGFSPTRPDGSGRWNDARRLPPRVAHSTAPLNACHPAREMTPLRLHPARRRTCVGEGAAAGPPARA